jgi:hypothetical protein
MTFTGYCSLKDLVSFLDIGEWIVNHTVNESYTSGDVLMLETTNASGVNTFIIEGTVKIYKNDVEVDSDDYDLDYDTGILTINTTPPLDTGDEIKATYYVASGYSTEDLEYYLLLGATELEYNTRQIFREQTVNNYTYTVEEGLDYTVGHTSKYIELPYTPILEVTSLEVDGVSITLSSLIIKGNKIFTTSSSEKQEFSSDQDIEVSFKYGITDTVLDRTDEDLRLLSMASEANKISTALIMAESPLGRNTFIDNSKVTQMSKGDVRPELFNEAQLRELRNRYNLLVNKLKGLSYKVL